MKNLAAITIMLAGLFGLLFSCTSKKDEDLLIPPGILSEEKFTNLLVDFSLAESASNLNIQNALIQKIDSVYAFDPLLENGVRKSQYDSSVMFYTEHPEVYKRVYDNVVIVLTEMQAKKKGIKGDSLKSSTASKPK